MCLWNVYQNVEWSNKTLLTSRQGPLKLIITMICKKKYQILDSRHLDIFNTDNYSNIYLALKLLCTFK